MKDNKTVDEMKSELEKFLATIDVSDEQVRANLTAMCAYSNQWQTVRGAYESLADDSKDNDHE